MNVAHYETRDKVILTRSPATAAAGTGKAPKATAKVAGNSTTPATGAGAGKAGAKSASAKKASSTDPAAAKPAKATEADKRAAPLGCDPSKVSFHVFKWTIGRLLMRTIASSWSRRC